MSGILLDSTDPNAIGRAIAERREFRGMVIKAAALYLDGKFPAPASAFPAIRRLGVSVIGITVTGAPAAHVGRLAGTAGDDEPGDLTPASAAAWAAEERHAGAWPVIYTDRVQKPATIAAALSEGLEPATDFGLWAATLDGTFADIGGADLRHEPGVVAVQAYPAKALGINADASVLTQLGAQWLKLPPSWEAQALTLADDLRNLLEQHV